MELNYFERSTRGYIPLKNVKKNWRAPLASKQTHVRFEIITAWDRLLMAK